MVLHNDKWAKKAKRAVERRKGITRRPGNDVPRTVGKLELDRDDKENSDAPSESSDASDDSFEFDSGEEGKTEAEKAQRRASAPKVNTAQEQAPTAKIQATKVAPPARNEPPAVPKVDKRFARRKLYDNSSRYEDFIDPYLQVEEYHTLEARPFTGPAQAETIPDERNARGEVLPMDDSSHFDALRLMQQKEEYKRDMLRRFGRRHAAEDSEAFDDDQFFDEVLASDTSKLAIESDKSTKKSQAVVEGEDFLDDLLKL